MSGTETILSAAAVITALIALLVSISSTRTQNKIALFEKKITLYEEIRTYFDGRNLFSTAEVKLMGGDAKFRNGYKGNKEYLFSEIKLLFNGKIWKLFSEIDELYKQILEADSKIRDYFSLLEQSPKGIEIKGIIKEYIERESHDWETQITSEEENDFKKACNDNEILFDCPIEVL